MLNRVVADYKAPTSNRSFDPKDYEEYLTKHIGNVQKAYAFLVDAGIIEENEETQTNIEKHDESKYSIAEFDAYGERFYGRYKDNKEDDPNFKYAWLHHQHNNPHHWQHWCLKEDDGLDLEALDMPEEYIVEMICDWLAFSIDKNDLSEIGKWYKKKKDRQILSEKTRTRVEELLGQIDAKKELFISKIPAEANLQVKANGDMIAYYRDHPNELKKKKEELKTVKKSNASFVDGDIAKVPFNASTLEEKRRLIEQRLRGDTQNLPNARDSEFDPGVYELLRQSPKLIGYIKPWMDTAQAVVILDAISAGVDVSKLQDPKYNFMQMQAILDYLKQDIDVTKYTKDGRNALIIRQIGEAIKQGMTDTQIRQMLFMRDWMQMREIRLGHKIGIDVSSYATKPAMDWKQMQEIRKKIAEEKRNPKATLVSRHNYLTARGIKMTGGIPSPLIGNEVTLREDVIGYAGMKATVDYIDYDDNAPDYNVAGVTTENGNQIEVNTKNLVLPSKKAVRAFADRSIIATITNPIYDEILGKPLLNKNVGIYTEIEDHANRHDSVYGRHKAEIPDAINNPSHIFSDKDPKRVMIVKENEAENYVIVLELSVMDGNQPNAIVTMMPLSDKRYRQYVRNREVLYPK